MKKMIMIAVLPLLIITCKPGDHSSQLKARFEHLSDSVTDGWNTWDNRSIMTHILLPEGLAWEQ
ncbi:MAG: hypothetical protein U5R06_12630 [candidate division KSB1 bacterium]|nr:hypothetical protein [candidate division KSB1 bacterium]